MASYNLLITQSGGNFTSEVRRGATAPTSGTLISFPGSSDATPRRHEAFMKGMVAVLNDASTNGLRTNWNIYLADSSGNFTTTVRYGVTPPSDGTVVAQPAGHSQGQPRLGQALIQAGATFLNDQQ